MADNDTAHNSDAERKPVAESAATATATASPAATVQSEPEKGEAEGEETQPRSEEQEQTQPVQDVETLQHSVSVEAALQDAVQNVLFFHDDTQLGFKEDRTKEEFWCVIVIVNCQCLNDVFGV